MLLFSAVGLRYVVMSGMSFAWDRCFAVAHGPCVLLFDYIADGLLCGLSGFQRIVECSF